MTRQALLTFVILATFLLLATACAKQGITTVPPEPTPGQVTEPTALLTGANGEVTVNGQEATVGQSLAENTTITTGAGSSAVITFLKGSILRLDENSEITIATLIPDQIDIEQLTGRSWSRLTTAGKPDDYAVYTPYAVATVRGTAFSVTVDDNGSTIAVADGIVATDSDDVNDTLETGEQANADEDELIIEPATLDTWTETNLDADDTFADGLADTVKRDDIDALDLDADEKHALRKAHLLGLLGTGKLTRERLTQVRARIQDKPLKEIARTRLRERVAQHEQRIAALATEAKTLDPKHPNALRIHKKQTIRDRTATAARENAFPLVKAAKTLQERRALALGERRALIQRERQRVAERRESIRERIAERSAATETGTSTETAETSAS